MTKNYLLFRHGITFASEDDTPYGEAVLSAPMLPEGIPAITRLGEYLKNIETDVNLSSPLLRCKQTVEIVTKVSGKSFQFEEQLREYYKETFAEFRERMENYLKELENSTYKNILICTHGAVIAAFKHLLLEAKFEEYPHLHDYPKTGIILAIKNGKVEEFSFRD